MLVEAFDRTQQLSRKHLPRSLRFRGGHTYPILAGVLEKGTTPSAKLDLQPGDRVRIESKRSFDRPLRGVGPSMRSLRSRLAELAASRNIRGVGSTTVALVGAQVMIRASRGDGSYLRRSQAR
jgi:hypothetical protein